MDPAVLIRVTEMIHARLSALEIGFLNVVHVLDAKGAASREDMIAAMRYSAEHMDEELLARKDILQNINRLIGMMEGASATQQAAAEDPRREMFQVIQGGLEAPPSDR